METRLSAGSAGLSFAYMLLLCGALGFCAYRTYSRLDEEGAED